MTSSKLFVKHTDTFHKDGFYRLIEENKPRENLEEGLQPHGQHEGHQTRKRVCSSLLWGKMGFAILPLREQLCVLNSPGSLSAVVLNLPNPVTLQTVHAVVTPNVVKR